MSDFYLPSPAWVRVKTASHGSEVQGGVHVFTVDKEGPTPRLLSQVAPYGNRKARRTNAAHLRSVEHRHARCTCYKWDARTKGPR